MKMTYQSEFLKLKTVYIKNVENAFVSDELVDKEWKPLNFLSKPNLNRAKAEYEKFEFLFKREGITIQYFPKDDSVSIDSIYCRDAAIATDEGMIICCMGKPTRANEPAAEQLAFEKNNISNISYSVFALCRFGLERKFNGFHSLSTRASLTNALSTFFIKTVFSFRNSD